MNDCKMSDISKHILFLLEDSSFPPLVMLDGDWGEGKTYYTKNTLIPELECHGEKCVFFSLTGLSSISDFKDRLLSASLLKNEINSEQGSAMSNIVNSLITNFGGSSGGTVASLLSGATGLIKESMLSRISNMIIIIDDLDRVQESDLCDLIVGECLQLSDTGRLKFIFIVNDEKSLTNKALKEKVFSGTVKLNRSISESVHIAFSGYEWFSEHKDDVIKAVEAKRLKNLRILKRVSKKINEIYTILQTDDSLDLNQCMSQIITTTILIVFYHYAKGLSESDIWNKSEYYNVMATGSDEKYEYTDLVDIRSFLTIELISYCVGGSNWQISICDFGRLPRKSCPIDAFLFSAHFELDDAEFEKKINNLQNFIFDENNVPFSKWFEASYFYHFLQSRGFFSLDRPELSLNFEELANKKDFDYSDLDGRTHRLRINSEDNFVFRKYVVEREKYRGNQEEDKNSDLFNRMKIGWGGVDMEIYKNYKTTPFFNILSINQLTEYVDGWGSKDILFFNDFLSDRYKASNISNYLSDELPIIKQLYKHVNQRFKDENFGRRKGALGFLADSLSFAIKSLEPKPSQI